VSNDQLKPERRLKPSVRRTPPVRETKFLDNRIRVREYADGVARVCYRPAILRRIRHNSNAWQFIGDFSLDQAMQIVAVFWGTIEVAIKTADKQRREILRQQEIINDA
jgi:hypothetical protein